MKKFAQPVSDPVSRPAANRRRLERTLKNLLGDGYVLPIKPLLAGKMERELVMRSIK